MQDIYLSKERLMLYRKSLEGLQENYQAFSFPSYSSIPELAEFEVELESFAHYIAAQFSQFTHICDIATDISRGGLLEDVLNRIYDTLQQIIPYDRIGCALINDDGDMVESIWAKTDYPSTQKLGLGFAANLEGSSLLTILETKLPRIINNLPEYLAKNPDSKSTRQIVEEGIKSSLTCPLIADNRPIGFLFFSSKNLNTYQDIHQKAFIFVSRQISVLVEKSRLYQQIYELNQQLTEAFVLLKEQSCRDSLTRVLHRGAIMEFLHQSFSEAIRKQSSMAVIMADLDHFKCINDTFGHLAGDEVLKQACEVIQSNLRDYDAVGRYGGEEFLIILTNTDEATAFVIAERIRHTIAEQVFLSSKKQCQVTISLGIACMQGAEEQSIETLLLRADSALYKAKAGGRNQTCIIR